MNQEMTRILKQPTMNCVHFMEVEEIKSILPTFKGSTIEVIEGSLKDVYVDWREPVQTEESLLKRLYEIMNYSGIFGIYDKEPSYNWNAFNDLARSLDDDEETGGADASGFVVVLHDSDFVVGRGRQAFGDLVGSWIFCNRDWIARSIGFHLVIVVSKEHIHY